MGISQYTNANEIFRFLQNEIQSVTDNKEANIIALMLLEHFMGLTRKSLVINNTVSVSTQMEENIQLALQRLKQHEPIQYVIGHTWFYGLKFLVKPGVFIPRPETEELVSLIIAKNKVTNPQILDLCCGSGCIAISLVKNIKAAKAYAQDISLKALEQTTNNAALNKVQVSLIHQDILEDKPEGSFDIIVSNPPYISRKERAKMPRNVIRHEPDSALFVPDKDPLLFYRRIAKKSKKMLKHEGQLYFEIHEKFGKEVLEMLKKENFQSELYQDMQDKDRMVRAWLK